jgi:hypothetical protein
MPTKLETLRSERESLVEAAIADLGEERGLLASERSKPGVRRLLVREFDAAYGAYQRVFAAGFAVMPTTPFMSLLAEVQELDLEILDQATKAKKMLQLVH